MAEKKIPALKSLGMTRKELADTFAEKYGKGLYHADALFRHLYSHGDADVRGVPEYQPGQVLAEKISEDFRILLPEMDVLLNDVGTKKYTLTLADGLRTESVLIPMSGWNTLCVSSQIGCGRACTFCETGRMGLVRNLHASEIVAQWAFAKFRMNITPRNIVFMGMGEPFDNFKEIIQAIRILSDPRGASIPKRRISISTSGHVEGIKALTELEFQSPDEAWRTVPIAVSLNAADDVTRNRLMPINKEWPLDELKKVLLDAPQSSIKDALYFEYVVIPGVNDTQEDAARLADWIDGLRAKVNIIPYHPGENRSWKAPDNETMDRFHAVIRSAGIECRTRHSRGKSIEAACGMLGGESRLS